MTFTVPKIGDKKKLLELSERNVKYYQLEKEKQKELVDPEHKIEPDPETDDEGPADDRNCRLISNVSTTPISRGIIPVAAMVCFKNAKPDKSEYRHFNIKTVEGPNDFASMEEIIFRRYKRLMDEEKPLPQLVIVDGGKGQLSAAMKSLEKLGSAGKDDRHRHCKKAGGDLLSQ